METLFRLMNETGDKFGHKLRQSYRKKLRRQTAESLPKQKKRRHSEIVDLPSDDELDYEDLTTSSSDSDDFLEQYRQTKKRNITQR
jgi:hypothetical protein